MNHHLWMMNIHFCLRKSLQNLLSHSSIDFHRSHRVIFSGTPCIHLKGKVLVRIYRIHIGYHLPGQTFKAFIFYQNHRTDSHNAEYLLKSSDRFIVIIFPLGLHIDSSIFLADVEGALHLL